MRNILILGTMLAVAGTTLAALDARERPAKSAIGAAPVLVELFTSQGCSSCPPADRLLSRLDAGIVALSRPVTYWDRLGWKDTLARAENDVLQRRYAARGLPGSGVYTPGAVVQGSTATVGSDEPRLRALIAAARGAKPIMLTQTGDRVTASHAAPGAELRFVAVAKSRPVKIVRGENGGRAIGYANVVLNEAATACAADTPCSAIIPAGIGRQAGADRWAAILQDREGGRVRAVRWIARPAK